MTLTKTLHSDALHRLAHATASHHLNTVKHILMLLLLLCVGVGEAWAEEVTATWDFTSSTAACATAANVATGNGYIRSITVVQHQFAPSPEPSGDEELFKATATTAWSVPANTTTPASLASYATITGGQMYVINAQNAAKDLVASNNFQMLHGNTFFKVTLSKALQENDVIDVKIKQNDSGSRGLWLHSFVDGNAYPNDDAGIKILTASTGSAFEDCTYKIKAGDYLIGKTDIYIYRATGNTTNFQNFTVTRPEVKPRTFVDFKVDFRTDPYTVVTPARELPSGVVISGSFDGTQHGYNSPTITVPVDGAVDFTIGSCQYGNHTVTVKKGSETLATLDNNNGCENSVSDIASATYTKYITYKYNSEEPATLTFVVNGYLPFFEAKACDYIPQVTVKYYDVDKTTLLETEVVDGSSALAYNASAIGKMTVADGKCYRGFWKNKADNKRVAEGFVLNTDLELYPSVTDMETATTSSIHEYDFRNSGFYFEEHDLISQSGGRYNDGQHGWAFSNGNTITLKLAGNATITVGNCVYPTNGTTKIIAKNANEETFGECDAVVASDGATNTFIYEGEAGDITLNITGGQAYIHTITVTHTGTLSAPTWSDEKSAWVVDAHPTNTSLNAQELVYAMSYVNSQSEHTKTLYLPNGTYDLGAAHNTSVPAGMHLIGESQDGVIIQNQPAEESINQTATLQIDGANVTLEKMTIRCRAPYGITTGGASSDAERGVCVQDCGNGSHYINVTLDGLQDTYYSNGANGMTATFDNCVVMGNVDFFCGNGNITVNNSRLLVVSPHNAGGTPIICAPATYTEELQGYVFNNCTIEAAPSSRSTNAFDCLTPGHSTIPVDNNYYLARAWYAGGASTEGRDRTPRVTFNEPVYSITPKIEMWGGSIGYAQTEERRGFAVITNSPDFSDDARVIDATSKPFGFATATDRTDTNSVNPTNVTGGGVYSIEEALALWDNSTYNVTYSGKGKKVIVLQSDGKTTAMDTKIKTAIANNDIIIFDGGGTNGTDFIVSEVMKYSGLSNKTLLGINGARICTEWFMTDYYKNLLDNVQTSSGMGVTSASTTSGGGTFKYDDNTSSPDIPEEEEYLTRRTLYEAMSKDQGGGMGPNEPYQKAGLFYFGGCSNMIIRNLKFVGPGSVDVGGNDLVAIINGSHHFWVDHCEFTDGIDGNFDITNESDFITVSWCKFSYTDRAYAHQNTNLIGSNDDYDGAHSKQYDDRDRLNITFAYNEWGRGCDGRMPMARFGKIHMLNNYYTCVGNSQNAMNPRKQSEFLIEGNVFAKGVTKTYKADGATAVTWSESNILKDPAGTKGTTTGTVTVPYQYMMLNAYNLPDVIALNGGAVLGKAPVFTIDLDKAADNPKAETYTLTAKLSDFLPEGKYKDGLIFSVWAESAHTFQWYRSDKQPSGEYSEYVKIDGANRNSYTYKPTIGETFRLKCMAYGVSGSSASEVLNVLIDGEIKPLYTLDLDDTKTYAVTSGSPQIFTVYAGDVAEGVTYQWYKSANADGSSATAIVDATQKSYTYNPTTAEIAYLFCRAHNNQGDTDSKIVKVRGTSRTVKFSMYATYDANVEQGQTSVYINGGTSNITDAGTIDAKITADIDGCYAEANRADGISGLVFTAGSTHSNPLGIYAEFTPTTAIANGDKIEVSINTSNSHNGDFGFYVCKANTFGENNANVIGTVTIPAGTASKLHTATFTASEDISSLYLIPFVKEPTKKVNLVNVVVYSGDVSGPVDDPAFTKDLEERYEVMKNAPLSLEVDYLDSDVASVQWYKNSTNSVTGATAIQDATSKILNVPTTELGTTFYYCVLTGQTGHTDATSTIAKVIVTDAVDTRTVEVIWDMKDCPGNTSTSETSIPKGSVKEIPSTTDPDNTITYHVRTGGDDAYRVSSQKFTDEGNEVTWTAYIKTNGSSAPASLSGVYEIDVPKAGQIVVYSRCSGSSSRYTYITQSKVDPASDGTGPGVVGRIDSYVNGAAANVVLKANVAPGKAYVGVTNGTYIYAIKYIYQEVIVPGTVDVKLGLTQEVNTTAKTIGSAVYSNGGNSHLTVVKQIGTKCNDNQTGKKPYYKNGTAEPEQYTATEAFRKTENTSTWHNDQYIGYKVTVANGYVLNLNKATLVLADESDAAYTCKVSIQDENGNVIKETSAITTNKKTSTSNIWNGINATDLAGDVYVKLMIYQAGGNKYFALPEFTVEGTVAPDLSTQCKRPSASKGDYVPAQEGYKYTLSSKTPSAKLHYKVDGGVTVDCAGNREVVVIPCGKSVVVWATDGNNVLDQSEEFEFTASAIPQLEKPGMAMTVYSHTTDPKGFTITITKDASEEVYYTTDGSVPSKDSESAKKYTSPFIVGGNVAARAIAVKDHFTDSPEATLSSPPVSSPGTDVVDRNKVTSETTYINASYTLDKQYIGGYANNISTGFKMYLKDNKVKIDVVPGFVITGIEGSVINNYDTDAQLTAINVDNVDKMTQADINIPRASTKTPVAIEKISNIQARNSLEFIFTETQGADTKVRGQINMNLVITYEFDDAPAAVTVDGTPLNETQLAEYKTNHTVAMDGIYPDYPEIIITSEKGYEYSITDGSLGDDGYTSFSKSFLGVDYIIKAKIAPVKSPNINIDENFSVAGGYKVTLSGDFVATTPYINIDEAVDGNGDLIWELYDSDKKYYALRKVQAKSKYTDEETHEESYTTPRIANCPDNSYTVGKPFAVFVRQGGYLDSQAGSQVYRAEQPEENDQIYQALAKNYNVIDFVHPSSTEVLREMPDIAEAKLVVITEMISGSGSYTMQRKQDDAPIDTKSTALTMSLLRDVVDKTNVLNFKMFTYSQSKNNTDRWGWGQPVALPPSVISVQPVNPVLEIFENVLMDADGGITLWQNIDVENAINHLQPVSNYPIDDEGQLMPHVPHFVSLAQAYDPADPETAYDALHYYEKTTDGKKTTYVGFGLSVNNWKNYNSNVYNIVDKICALINRGESLGHELDHVATPYIQDNGTGSATISSNNPNSTTYYAALTGDEYTKFSTQMTFEQQVATIKASELSERKAQFETPKYVSDMYIVAVSEYNHAQSAIAHKEVKGNKTRYIIRKDASGAEGQEAAWPFEVDDNPSSPGYGTATIDAFPFNQSWSKPGYTVKKWVTKPEDVTNPAAQGYVPGEQRSFGKDDMMHDITVWAVWEKNTKKITDLSATEDEAARTVKWEFLPSKGAPKIQIENNPKASVVYPTKALLVGQVKFCRDKDNAEKVTDWIDVTLNLDANTVSFTTPEGVVLANGGKFDNRAFYDPSKAGVYATDYAQIRSGALMTFPAVYGMQAKYHQMPMIKVAEENLENPKERSETYVSQSYITDGTKTGDTPNKWTVTNPGLELTGAGAIALNGYKATITTDNRATGGLFNYSGEGTTATLHTVESALWTVKNDDDIHTGDAATNHLNGCKHSDSTPTPGGGSCFMDYLSVTYPQLYDLTLTWNPEKSEIDTDENPAKMEKLNDAKANCDGRYMIGDEVRLKLTPAYAYYVPGIDEGDYTFLKNGETPLNIDTEHGELVQRYNDSHLDEETKKNIPVDGAYMIFKVKTMDLVVSLKKYDTYTINTHATPITNGTVEISTGTGRTQENEYKVFPENKTIVLTATAKRGYQFQQWENEKGEIYRAQERETGYDKWPDRVTPGTNQYDPFDPTPAPNKKKLQDRNLIIEVNAENAGKTYIARMQPSLTGTAFYLFEKPLMRELNTDGETYKADYIGTSTDLTPQEQGEFYSPFTSSFISTPGSMTLYKEGYTLVGWKAVKNMEGTAITRNDAHAHIPDMYTLGEYYYYSDADNALASETTDKDENGNTPVRKRYLQPILRQNKNRFDYRSKETDAVWDFRTGQYKEYMYELTPDNKYVKLCNGTLHYCTHVDIDGEIEDVPLIFNFSAPTSRLDNTTSEEWCALGKGTEIIIPSGKGATFTLATYAPLSSTNFDGVVPTEYYVEKDINGIDTYIYTYTTPSMLPTVKLTIGDDYTYYKYIKAHLPASDKVDLYTETNNEAFGNVTFVKAVLQDGTVTTPATVDGKTTVNLGSTVTVLADRQRLYGVKQWQEVTYTTDAEGNKTVKEVKTIWDEKAGITKEYETAGYTVITEEGSPAQPIKTSDGKRITNALVFPVTKYETYIRAVYGENELIQINYTSGKEAEGEAPNMVLIERGESFEVPEANHYLYLEGQTLKYWEDEDGNKYDFGQTYTPGQKFTASKDLPSGVKKDAQFDVPFKPLFLSPVFEVNDFTVMNLAVEAEATWPLARKDNGNVVVYFQSSVGVYVTPLRLTDGRWIDLKLDINCVAKGAKVDNQNSEERCQINTGSVISVPTSSNCTVTLTTATGSVPSGTTLGNAHFAGSGNTATVDYTGGSTKEDINFNEAGYFESVAVKYKTVTTELPKLDYVTIDNIALGSIGTDLSDYSLSTLRDDGKIENVPADLRTSLTGDMPVVKAQATNGGIVEITQATLENPEATIFVKTKDDVTVSVHKIGFSVEMPTIAPVITDLKVARQYQCNIKQISQDAHNNEFTGWEDIYKEGSYIYGYKEGEVAKTTDAYVINIQNVGIDGAIAIRFNNIMKAATVNTTDMTAKGGSILNQSISAEQGQTLVFSFWGLDLNTEYDFEINASTLENIYDKPYAHPIRLHFTTVETVGKVTPSTKNYFIVTQNRPSSWREATLSMEYDGDAQDVAAKDANLMENLSALRSAGKLAGYGTLDEGIEAANEYPGKDRFYIFVPDGEYQLKGTDDSLKVNYASGTYPPANNEGKLLDYVIYSTNGGKESKNGITAIKHSNISIIGQSQERTIVWNKPEFEGISYTATLRLNNNTTDFYAQDLTLENRFDYLTSISKQPTASAQAARAVVLQDRSAKAVFKNVTMMSYQDTYYSNPTGSAEDTRGYFEDCTLGGYVDFFCGTGDEWFERCNLIVRIGKGSNASNMMAPAQYPSDAWGYVLNNCNIYAEDAAAYSANNGKFTIARPWKDSPALSQLHTTYHVLPTEDGYKAMSNTGQVLRIHEYRSYNPDGTLIDLSHRSLRNSSPGAGSYDAVMTPAEAARYTVYNAMGGDDGYNPLNHVRQCPVPGNVRLDDRSMAWDELPEALCYFVFYADEADKDDLTKYTLFTLTTDKAVDISADKYLGKYFRVRAANERGGLGAWSVPIRYEFQGQYDLVVKNMYPRYSATDKTKYKEKSWSTLCLPFGTVVPQGSLVNKSTGEVNTDDKISVYAVTKVNGLEVHLKRVQHLDADKGYVVFATATSTDPEQLADASESRIYRFLGSTAEQEGEPTRLNGYAPAFIPNALYPNDRTKDTPSDAKLNRVAASVTCYTLAYKEAFGIGFYKYNGAELSPYRAWLDAENVDEMVNAAAELNPVSQASRLRFVFDDEEDPLGGGANAIDGVYDASDALHGLSPFDPAVLNDPDTRIFTLEGLRITPDRLRRGLVYIINGQKVQWR